MKIKLQIENWKFLEGEGKPKERWSKPVGEELLAIAGGDEARACKKC